MPKAPDAGEASGFSRVSAFLRRGGGKGRNPGGRAGQSICSKAGQVYLLIWRCLIALLFESDKMALRLLARAVAIFLPLGSLAASDLKRTDFEKFQCGGDERYHLEAKLVGVLMAEAPKHFEHWWTDTERDRQMGSPDANGWREFEYPFVETEWGKDERGPVAQKPWRKWDLTGRVRKGDGDCELADLDASRDWVADVNEHVINECFRYYAHLAGYRSEDDLDLAVRLMGATQGNLGWITRTVIAVKDDPIMEISPSGGSLRMVYRQHVRQCQREIDEGRLAFEAADMDDLRRMARGE